MSGVSGEGVIAEGVLFSDGWAVTHWLDQPPMNEPKTEVWHHKGVEPFEKISGHGGRTRIVWDDEAAAARQSLRADILDAFAVPASILPADDELSVLRERVERALRSAAARIQQEWHFGGGQSFPGAMELTGDLDAFTDALLPIVVHLQAERSHAQAAVDRASALGARWKATPGWASHLVRVAGAELLDELDDSAAASDAVVHPVANTEVRNGFGVDESGPVPDAGRPLPPGLAERAASDLICHAYLPPRTQENSGLCDRCGMFDFRHQHAEQADAITEEVTVNAASLECAATVPGLAEPAREVLRDTARRLRAAHHLPEQGV
ncbi:hypothetical protein ACFZC3_15260 [Streptomyces sp. NPDC007903]|uniref:hypothetical protein n=1 Tax=Streptomyces sp. NPDC007903 TaxID=3364786 RepID=UPI0036EBFDE6